MRIRYFSQYLGDCLGFVSRNCRNFRILWIYRFMVNLGLVQEAGHRFFCRGRRYWFIAILCLPLLLQLRLFWVHVKNVNYKKISVSVAGFDLGILGLWPLLWLLVGSGFEGAINSGSLSKGWNFHFILSCLIFCNTLLLVCAFWEIHIIILDCCWLMSWKVGEKILFLVWSVLDSYLSTEVHMLFQKLEMFVL